MTPQSDAGAGEHRSAVAGIAREIALRKAWFPLAAFALHAWLAALVRHVTPPPPLHIPMHLLGGLALAYFFHGAMQIAELRLGRELAHGLARPVLVVALVCAAAVCWECVQFVWDLFAGTRLQPGLDDTLFDVFLIIQGCLAYVLWRVR